MASVNDHLDAVGPSPLVAVGDEREVLRTLGRLHGRSHSRTPLRRHDFFGVSSPARSRHLPQAPTIAEAGVPGYYLENWWRLAAPGGVPAGIVERLNAEVASILAEPDASRRLEDAGAEPKPVSSAEFTRLVHTELTRWAKVAREANITLD